MWLKLTGILLVLFSGTAAGWLNARKYLRRIKYLQELQLAVNLINTEINYRQTPLPEVLIRMKRETNYPVAGLFDRAAGRFSGNTGERFYPIWKEVLTRSFLNQEDKEIMLKWGKQLGGSDLGDQKRINKMTVTRLQEAEKKASQKAEKKVKLSRYAGVLLSLLVIIILL